MATDVMGVGTEDVVVDRWRAIVFPNRVREQRQAAGFPKLMALAGALPAIPYIRLSKIERGEVVPRADELTRIAAVLGIAADALLLDVDAPGFDLADWAAPFTDGAAVDDAEERFAVMLAAAVRWRRRADRALTIAALDKQWGLPPVILSRIEHAQKPLGRWNAGTRAALVRLFDAADEAGLRAAVQRLFDAGDLYALLPDVGDAGARQARTRERIASVAADLAAAPPPPPPPPPIADAPLPVGDGRQPRMLAVAGEPRPGGLIAPVPVNARVEAPAAAGPRALALRVGRATLGAGMPGHATLVIDPDRFPAAGGLAMVREGDQYRLLAVTQDRDGRLTGYSVTPAVEVDLDSVDPDRVAAVVAALFT